MLSNGHGKEGGEEKRAPAGGSTWRSGRPWRTESGVPEAYTLASEDLSEGVREVLRDWVSSGCKAHQATERRALLNAKRGTHSS